MNNKNINTESVSQTHIKDSLDNDVSQIYAYI